MCFEIGFNSAISACGNEWTVGPGADVFYETKGVAAGCDHLQRGHFCVRRGLGEMRKRSPRHRYVYLIYE